MVRTHDRDPSSPHVPNSVHGAINKSFVMNANLSFVLSTKTTTPATRNDNALKHPLKHALNREICGHLGHEPAPVSMTCTVSPTSTLPRSDSISARPCERS